MKNKIIKTPFVAALGTAVVSAFTANVAQAEADPFAVSELSSGYMQVAESYSVVPWPETKVKAKEASCGEGKCGDMMDGKKMKKGLEKTCGAMMKGKEGACGEMGKKAEKVEKVTEAKCGEGKCGDMMDGKKMKKGLEKTCGAMMKGKEGACGEMGKKAEKVEKVTEAKCGEGKCGDMMDGNKMKKGLEKTCGAMMKGKEGACGAVDKKVEKIAGEKCTEGKCGEGKCGDDVKSTEKLCDMKSSEMVCGSKMKEGK